jgi:hypothetical protein
MNSSVYTRTLKPLRRIQLLQPLPPRLVRLQLRLSRLLLRSVLLRVLLVILLPPQLQLLQVRQRVVHRLHRVLCRCQVPALLLAWKALVLWRRWLVYWLFFEGFEVIWPSWVVRCCVVEDFGILAAGAAQAGFTLKVAWRSFCSV